MFPCGITVSQPKTLFTFKLLHYGHVFSVMACNSCNGLHAVSLIFHLLKWYIFLYLLMVVYISWIFENVSLFPIILGDFCYFVFQIPLGTVIFVSQGATSKLPSPCSARRISWYWSPSSLRLFEFSNHMSIQLLFFQLSGINDFW